MYFSKFLPETMRFKSYSPLKYFIQVSTKSSILFSIFIKSCIFFSIYTILNKLNQGQYGLTHTGWPILSFNHRQYGLTQIVHLEKIDQFLWKYIYFHLCILFWQNFKQIQIKCVKYNLNHVVLCNFVVTCVSHAATFLQKLFCFSFVFSF